MCVRTGLASFGACMLIAAVAGSMALAQPADTSHKPAGQPEMKLPPGWTAEDMQACMMAGMPGKEHQTLMSYAGTWKGECKMWMGPGMDPITTTQTWTMTPFMDGRFLKNDVTGDIPGMGPFVGMGLTGFDNVSKKFVGTWVDSMGSGIMNGTGELSADGKTETWSFTYNCPVTKKPTVMREILHHTSPTTMTVEFHMVDPKSGKEYKGMEHTLTKSK